MKNLEKHQYEGLKQWMLKDCVLIPDFGKILSEYQTHNAQPSCSSNLYLVSRLFIYLFRIADSVSMIYIAILQLSEIDLEPCQWKILAKRSILDIWQCITCATGRTGRIFEKSFSKWTGFRDLRPYISKNNQFCTNYWPEKHQMICWSFW